MYHLQVAQDANTGKSGFEHRNGSKRRLGATSLVFDPARDEVSFALASVSLTPAEALALQRLAHHRAAPLSRDALLAGVPTSSPALAEICVLRLRRKLAGLGWDGEIQTVPGRGYRLSELGDERFRAPDPIGTIDPAAPFGHGEFVHTVPRGRASPHCASAAEGATGPRKRSGSRTAWDMNLWKAGGSPATAPTE